MTREDVAQILGSRYQSVCQCVTVTEDGGFNLLFFPLHSTVEVVREKGFHLDIEDYLAGVLIMASELVSLLTALMSHEHILYLSCLNQQRHKSIDQVSVF